MHLWKNVVSHRTSYAELRESPAAEASHLAMELTKKCQLSRKSSSLTPYNFQSHLEPFPRKHWKDKHPSSLLLKMAFGYLYKKWCQNELFPKSALRTLVPDFLSAFSTLPSDLYKAGFRFNQDSALWRGLLRQPGLKHPLSPACCLVLV